MHVLKIRRNGQKKHARARSPLKEKKKKEDNKSHTALPSLLTKNKGILVKLRDTEPKRNKITNLCQELKNSQVSTNSIRFSIKKIHIPKRQMATHSNCRTRI